VLILGFFTGLIFLFGPSVGIPMNEVINSFPESFKNLKAVVSQNKYGHMIIGEIPDDFGYLIKDQAKVASQVIGSFITALSIITNIGIIIVTGIFLAKDLEKYKNGFVSSFPVSFRPKLIDVMDKIHHILSLWMSAKLMSNSIVGLLTAVGLQLLGIPLAYALALLAALCSFIPNIGHLLALIPA
jgi:predicted PurR-regulated permease PerM